MKNKNLLIGAGIFSLFTIVSIQTIVILILLINGPKEPETVSDIKLNGEACTYSIALKSKDFIETKCEVLDQNDNLLYRLRDCSIYSDDCYYQGGITLGKKSPNGRYIIYGAPSNSLDTPWSIYEFNYKTSELTGVKKIELDIDNFLMSEIESKSLKSKCNDLRKNTTYTPECFINGDEWAEFETDMIKTQSKELMKKLKDLENYVDYESAMKDRL